MFAVPGWAVPASSLVEEKPKTKTSDTEKVPSISTDKSKKRKREEVGVGLRPPKRLDRRSQGNDNEPEHSRRVHAETLHQRIDAGRNLHTHISRTSTADKRNENGSPQTSDVKGRGEQTPKSDRTHENLLDLRLQKSLQTRITDAGSKQLSTAPSTRGAKLTPLQAKMRNKLTSARFRQLNEKLYTTSSSDAFNLFTSSPNLFAEYHAGFSQQVKDSWPQNPVDEYVKTVKIRGALSDPRQGRIALPRRKTGSCTIVDLGCGDAPLARGCQSVVKTLKLKFHNYDLHAPNTFVTKADISALPLRDGEADIAIFCLSLMGTNWIDFVEEAWRILRGDGKGEVWVAEVKSRFGRATRGRVVENSVGKKRKTQTPKRSEQNDEYNGPERFVEDDRTLEQDDETDVSAFTKVFTRRGFQLREGSVDKNNKMFVTMIFTKTGIPTAGRFKGLKWNGKEYQKQNDGRNRFVGGQKHIEELMPEDEAKALKPCVYKIR